MVAKRFRTALAVIVPGLLMAGTACAQSQDELLLKELGLPTGCETNEEQLDFQLVSFTEVDNQYKCQLFCVQNPLCVEFTYYTNKQTCVLHSRGGKKVGNGDARHGPKRCPACLVPNADITTPTIIQKTVASVQECATYCNSLSCTFYVYTPADSRCSIKKYVPDLQSKIVVREGSNVGNYSCYPGQGWCFADGFELSGESLKEEKVENVFECSDLCINNTGCEAFVYNKTSKTCTLKPALDYSRAVQNRNTISGPPHCGLPRACEEQGVRRTSGFLTQYSKDYIRNSAGCLKKCLDNGRCYHYTFGDDGCSLHGMDSVTEPSSSHLSGSILCNN